MKYYELKKGSHIIGLSNCFHDKKLFKAAIKNGYKIIKVTIVTDKQDSYGRTICKYITLC